MYAFYSIMWRMYFYSIVCRCTKITLRKFCLFSKKKKKHKRKHLIHKKINYDFFLLF